MSDGNTPFGSLLVVDGTVVRRSTNTTMTDDDITAHPELELARWAARELDAEALADCTIYTSTESCEMCATAIHYAGIDRVSTGGAGRVPRGRTEIEDFRDGRGTKSHEPANGASAVSR
ncbi:tRNA(Arg) A34 adenosine deaminase TadA [Halapricum desulfuricans]|uniref:tRNA(Arg) A34 adenosine deaminase TadA n=1 Tax=Halapricum desulfuricans TaxID=2841257 RepID=A0A897MZS0_9EURY|nr:tRNA(Arg) A34 adenosine deaminase TadA [Halapricum desulfuricans]